MYARTVAGVQLFAAGVTAAIVAPLSVAGTAWIQINAVRNPIVGARLTLVLGGARSGKSRYAETIITALPPPWVYVATAQALDAEMTARIDVHRARRGAGWTAVETACDLVATLAANEKAPILVDCLTLWLSNL